MKRILTVALSVLLLFSCFSAFAAEIPSDLPKGSITENTRLYETASTKSDTVVKLKKDAAITIIGQTKSFYWAVFDNDAGFVLKKYVDFVEADDDAATANTSADTQEKEPKKNIGTRKNPAPLGESVVFSITAAGIPQHKVSLTMTDVITGSKAWSIIYAENMFNDPPQKGYQYVLAKFSMTYLEDLTELDEPISYSRYHFDSATADFSISDTPSVVTPEPAFDARLFEGASSSGWVVFEVKENETSYAVFNPVYSYSNVIWFELT